MNNSEANDAMKQYLVDQELMDRIGKSGSFAELFTVIANKDLTPGQHRNATIRAMQLLDMWNTDGQDYAIVYNTISQLQRTAPEGSSVLLDFFAKATSRQREQLAAQITAHNKAFSEIAEMANPEETTWGKLDSIISALEAALDDPSKIALAKGQLELLKSQLAKLRGLSKKD